MKQNKIILSILTFSILFAQFDWADNGLPLRQGGHIEWQRSGAVGNDGEMIFVWSDTRYGVRDIFAQKVDIDGNLLWDEDGTPIVLSSGRQEDPITVSDDNGGAYIVWVDYDAEPEIGDIYAQHILSDGTLAWDEPRGVALTTVPGKQLSPNICKDGLGGAYVIWDDRSEVAQGEIFATHISADGSIVEPGVGVLIMNHPMGSRSGISLETGGSGHAVLGWADDRDGNYKIYSQRIDQNCNTIWSNPNEGGVLVCDIGYGDGLNRHPRITYVGADVSVMVWEDYRYNTFESDVFLQFLDGDGSSLLQDNGIEISIASGAQYLPRVKADENFAYIVWEDLRNHPVFVDIYAQKVGLDGIIHWEENGRPICDQSGQQYGSRLTVDGEGGAYFIWSDERNASFPEMEIFLQHINSENEESFESNGLSITEAPYKQELPLVRKDGYGGAFAIWGDWRTGGSVGINIQHIDPEYGVTLETDGLEIYFDIDGDVEKGFIGSLYLGNDRSLIYWQDQRWNPFSIETYGKIIDASYNPPLYDNGNSLSTNPNQLNPQTVRLGDKIFLLFESFNNEELEHLYFNIYDMDLNPITDPYGTSIYDNISPQYNSKIISNDEHVFVAYSDLRDWVTYDVVVQKFDEFGNPQWGDGGIIVNLEWDDFVESIVALPDGGCVVFWTGGDIADLNVYYKAFDENGETPAGWNENPQTLSGIPGTQNDIMAVNYDDGTFVIWIDYQSGNADIYGQFISFNGEILGPENGLPIAINPGDEYHPEMTYNGINNELFLVWEYDAGNFDIMGSLISPDNVTIGEPFSIVEQPSDQTEPTVYTSQGGTYMLMWRDGRLTVEGEPPIYDIYYQELDGGWFNFNDGGIPICDFTYNQTNPKIDLLSESSDSYILFWNDMRSTGKQDLVNLYGQSLTPSQSECNLYDVNEDGAIDILDIVITISIILESIEPTIEQVCAADVNEDGSIDILDIVLIIAQILDT